MICPKCGKEISDQARFCPKCGIPISNAEASVPESTTSAIQPDSVEQADTSTVVADKPAEKRKSRAPLVAIPIAAALLVTVLFLLLPKNANPPEDGAQNQEESGDMTPVQGETKDDVVSVPDANAELLALIDQAVEESQNAVNAVNAVLEDDTIDDFEAFRQAPKILVDSLAVLIDLQREAAAISGLDSKMKSAGDECFDMMCSTIAAFTEYEQFFGDYNILYWGTIYYRPNMVDYSFEQIEDYISDLSAWTQEVLEGYAAISCPDYLKNEWTRYGKILEYNESIVKKLNEGIQYNDWLRIYSSIYMTDRYNTVGSNAYDNFLTCINNETEHAYKQWDIAIDLIDEMYAYAKLNQEEKEAYEFSFIRAGEVVWDYETVDTIYPSLYNTYDAFAILKTGCISGTKNIVIEAEIPGFTQKYQEMFRLDSAYTAIYIKPPALTGELDLTSAKSAQINITVSEQDGTLIDSKSFPVTIKSKYDFEWYSADYGTSTQDDILCFLTPESPAITELKRQAIDEIATMTGNAMESFVGYQEAVSNWSHYTITYLQVAGLMNALYEMGIRYNMNPFSISGSNQHILYPEDVLTQRSGLCVETALTIASALQSANMHAFLLFPPGHAQVAVEAWNSGTGRGEYFLIETTYLNSDINNKSHFVENANKLLNNEGSTGIITYYNANSWADYLQNSVEYVVDCDDAQLLGLTQFTN